MTTEQKEKIGLIIIDTLYEYLSEKKIQGYVIIESQFDDIVDDLISKLFDEDVKKSIVNYGIVSDYPNEVLKQIKENHDLNIIVGFEDICGTIKHTSKKCLKCGSEQLYRSITGKLCCTYCILG